MGNPHSCSINGTTSGKNLAMILYDAALMIVLVVLKTFQSSCFLFTSSLYA